MTPIYAYILLGSILVPALFSFFCIDFIKRWRAFTYSTLATAFIFLIWDAIFTHFKIWGFNHFYCMGFYLFKMPIEEWLFFIIIPFCSLFTHFALFYAYPTIRIPKKITQLISYALLLITFFVILVNWPKAYTSVNFSFLFIIVLLGLLFKLELLQRFYISFFIILIPFFIVNGILTGAITETPIVWYDDTQNLSIRLHTIPVEDIGYAFSMLFLNLMVFDTITKKRLK